MPPNFQHISLHLDTLALVGCSFKVKEWKSKEQLRGIDGATNSTTRRAQGFPLNTPPETLTLRARFGLVWAVFRPRLGVLNIGYSMWVH